ncbi:GerAB/ArcD/ProY family transporter [Metabacillus niabensis]|uniref:Spore germination protein KB n=1 Tax=Metabacillus niabensis TaxID=324854 RepID=A0ABT9Z3J9_9BACI|nr:endospore germination permease [Metabacillus niabensis]MDQ0226431.1 spore germination protein KB [Metabacillus niabensis]
MNENVEKISIWQLYILIIGFQVGSAVLVGIGNEAKGDAWIAVIIGTIIGVAIIWYYLFILKKLPGKNLFEIILFCFGKWIGKPLIFLYVIYFLYLSARVLRDFDELIVSSIFEFTPIEFISITMILTIVYILHQGVEVLGRTSEVFFPYVLTFIVFIGLFLLLSGEMDFHNLQPVLGDGFKPVMNAIFPGIITFPFGESIAFMCIFSKVITNEKVTSTSIIAVLTSGFLLTYSAIIQIATLGVNLKERTNFPLLNAAREISLLDFIERVDILIVFTIMFGVIVKVSIFFYCGLKGIEALTHKTHRSFTLPLGAIIAFLSIEIASSYREHIIEGLKFVPLYIHLPLQFGIPLFILPFLFWKAKKKQKKESNQ